MPLANSNINPSQNYKVNFSVTASAATNSTFTGFILQNQTDTTGIQQMFVPPNQVWKVVDSFVPATQTPDMLVDVIIDNTAQNMNWDANTTSLALGTTRQNPFAYMQNGGLIVGATSGIQIRAAIQAANGTSAVTTTVTIVIVQYPIGK